MTILKHSIDYLYNKSIHLKTFLKNQQFDIIFDHEGYVAGGFARCCVVGIDFVDYFEMSRSDVDFFFSSQKKQEECVEKLLSKGFRFKNSITGFASNFSYATKNNMSIRVQLIKLKSGPVEDVLDSFDLRNCKAAFNLNECWIHDEIEELEKSKTIKIDSFNSEYLAHRIFKYSTKHKFDNIDPKSLEGFKEWIIKRSEEMKPKPCLIPFFNPPGGPPKLFAPKPNSIGQICALMNKENFFSEKDLVLFSSLFQGKDMNIYDNPAISILRKRIYRKNHPNWMNEMGYLSIT